MASIECIVRGVLIHEGRVLLCRHRGRGHRYLPGGHIEPGEPATAALVREMQEELGIALPVRAFLGASEGHFQQGIDAQRKHEINLYFRLGLPEDGAAFDPASLTSREEKIAFDWIDLADLTGEPPNVTVLPNSAPQFIDQAARQRASHWASDWHE